MNFHIFERTDGALLLMPSMLDPQGGHGHSDELRPRGALDCDLSVFSAELVTQLGLHGRAIVQGHDRELLMARMRLADTSAAGSDEAVSLSND